MFSGIREQVAEESYILFADQGSEKSEGTKNAEKPKLHRRVGVYRTSSNLENSERQNIPKTQEVPEGRSLHQEVEPGRKKRRLPGAENKSSRKKIKLTTPEYFQNKRRC